MSHQPRPPTVEIPRELGGTVEIKGLTPTVEISKVILS